MTTAIGASPRVLLFMLLLGAMLLVALTMVAPALLIYSAHCAWITSSSWLQNPYRWFETAGGSYAASILCPLSNAQCDERGMQIGNTLSAFQALFAVTIAVGAFKSFWLLCRDGIDRVTPKIDELQKTIVGSEDPELSSDEYTELFHRRSERWLPRFITVVHWTISLGRLSFFLTAIVAGNVLIVPFFTGDDRFQFKPEAALIFVAAPFVVFLMLQLDVFVATLLAGPTIAPALFWKNIKRVLRARISRVALIWYGTFATNLSNGATFALDHIIAGLAAARSWIARWIDLLSS